MGTYDKVCYGPVDAYIKAYAADNDPVTGNVVADLTDWTNLNIQGVDGLKENIVREGNDIKVHEAGLIDNLRIVEYAEIELPLEQMDLQKIGLGLANATYTAGAVPGTNPNIMGIGCKATDDFISLYFQSTNYAGQVVGRFYPKCKGVGPMEHSYNKNGVTLVPYMFKAFLDLSRAAGEQLVKVYEESVAEVLTARDKGIRGREEREGREAEKKN